MNSQEESKTSVLPKLGLGDQAASMLAEQLRVKPAARLRHGVRPNLTFVVTALSDAIGLLLSALLASSVSHPLSVAPVLLLMAAITLGCNILTFGPGLTAAAQARRITLAVLLTHVPAVFLAALVGNSLGGLAQILMCAIFSCGFLLLSRAVLHEMFAKRRWWGCPVAVIADTPAIAERVLRAVSVHSEMGLKPVVVIRNEREENNALADYRSVQGLRVLCGPAAVERLRKWFGVSYVVTMGASGRELLLLRVGIADACFAKMSLYRRLAPLIGIQPIRPGGAARSPIAKQVLDLLATSFGMILILPVMLLIAVLIKLDSKGPIFFRQKRPGTAGQPFRILKFRTMRVGAARMQKKLPPELLKEFETYGKIRNDSRVTRVGRWLRKTSLDELPQMINILRGDMSLVGPRPHLMYQRANLVEHHASSLRAMPGLTGLWQISGRSGIPFELRLAMDAYYAEVANIWLDLYILARTVLVVLSGKGAY